MRERRQRCLSSLTEATGVNSMVSSSFQVTTAGWVELLFASKNMSTLNTPKRPPLRGQVGIKLTDTSKEVYAKTLIQDCPGDIGIKVSRRGYVCACFHVWIRKKRGGGYATAVQTQTDGRGGAVSWGKKESSCQQKDTLAASSLFD